MIAFSSDIADSSIIIQITIDRIHVYYTEHAFDCQL